MADMTYVGWCKYQLPVVQGTAGYTLGSACSTQSAGTPMELMQAACASCPYKGMDLPAVWRAQLAASTPVPAAAQLPAVVTQPTWQPPQSTGVAMSATGTAPGSALQPQMQGLYDPPPSSVQPPVQVAQAVQVAQPVPAAVVVSPPTSTSLSVAWLLDKPDINDLVEAALAPLKLGGGSSSGGISWHSLDHTRCWLRAFRAHVLGLRKKIEGDALAFGTLYHACLERYYSSGGNPDLTFEPCEAVRMAGGAEIAAEVRALVMGRLTHPVFSLEEATTWCPRGTEVNAIGFLEPVKLNGKTYRIPVTCRHDMLIHIRQPHEPVPGPGAADGMHICDFKSTSQLTADLVKGYALDGQLMTNIWCYLEAEEESYGKLRGVIVDVAAKHKRLTPDSYQRVRDAIDVGAVGRFYRDELMVYGVELYRRLISPEYRTDQSQWPMDRKQCVGKWLCPYFDLCAFGEGEMHQYRVHEHRILRPEGFAVMPKGWVTRSAPPPAAEIVTRTEEKRVAKAAVKIDKDAFAAKLIESLFEGLRGLSLFQVERYLVSGHTRKSVEVALIESLMVQFRATFAVPGADGQPEDHKEWTAGDEQVELRLRERGLSWSFGAGKGTIYWRAIAERICKDWWDLSRVEATLRDGSKAIAQIPRLPVPPPPAADVLAADATAAAAASAALAAGGNAEAEDMSAYEAPAGGGDV